MELVHSFVATLPIPRVDAEVRARIETLVQRLISITRSRQEGTALLLDWLAMGFGIEKPSQKLQAPHLVGPDAWVAEVKKLRGRAGLSAGGLKQLRDEYEATIRPLVVQKREADALEREISKAVNTAYGLTPQDVELMWKTAPPRMPIAPP